MTDKFLVLALLVIFIPLSAHVQAQNYDLVISNGRVMDPETNFDSVANVGIKDGKVAKISLDKLSGTRVIDASGHVVAPGFVDFHSHGQEPFAFRLYARDGVTTPMDLEMGAYPIEEFYAYWKDKAPRNYGSAVSHAFARLQVLDKLDAGGRSIIEDYVPQMKERGRLQDGSVADITIFDPETVTDNATPEIGKNSLPSTGIPYVIVNGKVVVDDSKVQRIAAGVAIRNPVVH